MQFDDVCLRECKARDVLLSKLLQESDLRDLVEGLRVGGCCSALELLVRVETAKHLTPSQRADILLMCGKLFAPSQETCLGMTQCPALSWGCPVLDPIWGGRLLLQGIWEFAGAAGTGKTQIMLWLARRALLESKPKGSVLYIGTEGEFPSKRFAQMTADFPDASSRIILDKASNFDELWTVLTTRVPVLLIRCNVKLLIIDSMGALRSDYDVAENSERADLLLKIGQYLKWLNDRYACGIIVTNQVRANMEDGRSDAVVPALGLIWTTMVNTRILLSKSAIRFSDTDSIPREMRIEMCPYLPKMAIPFEVCAVGIKGVESK